MAPPTFQSFSQSAWNTTTSPKTVSITATAGDTLVVIGISQDSGTTLGTPTGGGLSYTLQQTVAVSSYCYTRLWTATSSTSQTFTLSLSSAGGGLDFGVMVYRFSGVSALGASAQNHAANTTPSLPITTQGANSALVVGIGDWNAIVGPGTWLTVNVAATSELYNNIASQYTVYSAYYSDTGPAGAKTAGLSAPTGEQSAIVGIELKSGQSGSAALAGSGSLTDAATLTATAAVSLAGAGSLSDSAALTETTAASLAGAGALTATLPANWSGTVSLVGSSALTAGPAQTETATAALAGSGALTAIPPTTWTGVVNLAGASSLTAAATQTETGAVALAGSGSLADTPTLAEKATVTLTGAGTLTDTATSGSTTFLAGAGSLSATGAAGPGLAMLGLGTLTAGGAKLTELGVVTFAGASVLTTPVPALGAAASITLAGTGQLVTIFSLDLAPVVLDVLPTNVVVTTLDVAVSVAPPPDLAQPTTAEIDLSAADGAIDLGTSVDTIDLAPAVATIDAAADIRGT